MARTLLLVLLACAAAAPAARAGGTETRGCDRHATPVATPDPARGDVVVDPMTFVGGPNFDRASHVPGRPYMWKTPVLLEAGRNARVSVRRADRGKVSLVGTDRARTIAAGRHAIRFESCRGRRTGFPWAILTSAPKLCLRFEVASRGRTRIARIPLGGASCP